MQFVFPTFLIALAAIAIPIIIHLFYFRRFKKVYFTNVRFLKEVKEETSARSRLKNLLVLLMRILALAFIVFAFVQPFLRKDTKVNLGEKSISVFIDNSFSMKAVNEEIPLLTLAKDRARAIIEAYGNSDRFQVLTNDFEGRHQRLLSQDDALSLIDEIEESPAVRSISTVLNRQKQTLESGKSDQLVSYLISDFQRNITDLENWEDTSLSVNMVPLQSVKEQNLSIDTAWFESPVQMFNQNSRLFVRIRNWADEPAENIRLSFTHEGQTKPVGTFSVPAKGSVLDTVNVSVLRTGWHNAELKLTDFPVQFDDTYLLAFEVAEKISVLEIYEDQPNTFLKGAFDGMGYFELSSQPARSLDYSSFPAYQLIILHGLPSISSGFAFELEQYLENGGNILLFPDRNANLESYNSFLKALPANELQAFSETVRTGANLNTQAFVFREVFENAGANLKLPVTQGNFPLTRFGSRAEEVLLSYRDGSSFLGQYRIDQGHFFLCSAPLNQTYNNLIRSGEIFVPMLYRMALSSGKTRPIAYTIGSDEVIEVGNTLKDSESVFKIAGGGNEFIPEQRNLGPKIILSLHNQIERAGFYDLRHTEEETLERFAFNYDRRESDLACFTASELENRFPEANFSVINAGLRADMKTLVGERNQGKSLWKWCIILALLFLALESVLLRFWKV
ncbi:MAG: BatA domain-containing protein [Saprospiraceae bacterium]|nr:BatA domain-containing protein [Saprospiraceae bacterium]